MNHNPFMVFPSSNCERPYPSPQHAKMAQYAGNSDACDLHALPEEPLQTQRSPYSTNVPSDAAIRAAHEQLRSNHGSSSQHQYGGMDDARHSYSLHELSAFVRFVNSVLRDDPDLKDVMPIDEKNEDLFKVISQGVLLPKLLNKLKPNSRKIYVKNPNAFEIQESHNATIQMAKEMGCNLINIGPSDLVNGTPHLVLGFIWQILNKALLSNVTVENHPQLLAVRDKEDAAAPAQTEPESNLLTWFNHHLRQAGANRRVRNFSEDVSDGECYLHLLRQILKTSAIDKREIPLLSPEQRAELVCKVVANKGLVQFMSPENILSGDPKLNTAFVAYLFNTYPAFPTNTNLDSSKMEEISPQYANSSNATPFGELPERVITDGRLIRPSPICTHSSDESNSSQSSIPGPISAHPFPQRSPQQFGDQLAAENRNSQNFANYRSDVPNHSYSPNELPLVSSNSDPYDHPPHPYEQKYYQPENYSYQPGYSSAPGNYLLQGNRPPPAMPNWGAVQPIEVVDTFPVQQQFVSPQFATQPTMWTQPFPPQQSIQQYTTTTMTPMYHTNAPRVVFPPVPNLIAQPSPMIVPSTPITTSVIQTTNPISAPVSVQSQKTIITTNTTYY